MATATIVELKERAVAPAEKAAEQTPWPEPDLTITDLRHLPAPAFPVDVLGPWQSWVVAAAECKGAPVDFVALPLLCSIGGLLANVRRPSPWGGWVEPPILWGAAVGLPSSGKSPALDAVTELLEDIERDSNADWQERLREHETTKVEGKAKRAVWEAEVADAVKARRPPPPPPEGVLELDEPQPVRIMISDATIEKLARLAIFNLRGLISYRDELPGWIGGMDRYGGKGSDRGFWLEAFGGRRRAVDRMKDGAKPIIVPHLSVSIIGGVQPDKLASTMLSGDDDGLAARFLYAFPNSVPPRRPRRTPDNLQAREALRRLFSVPFDKAEDSELTPRIVPLTEAAAGLIQQWREQVALMEGGSAGLFTSWLGKLPGVAVRLALVLEWAWWSMAPSAPEPVEVSARATTAAIGLLDAWAVPMARRCMGEAALPQTDRDAVALARWVMAQPASQEPLNARTIRNLHAPLGRDPERYDAAFRELEQAGWVRRSARAPGAGRPAKTYDVNPKLRVSS